jgi:hypothetical protein
VTCTEPARTATETISISYTTDPRNLKTQLEVPAGTTLGQFFQEQYPLARPSNYIIRVNTRPCASTRRLVEGDAVRSIVVQFLVD